MSGRCAVPVALPFETSRPESPELTSASDCRSASQSRSIVGPQRPSTISRDSSFVMRTSRSANSPLRCAISPLPRKARPNSVPESVLIVAVHSASGRRPRPAIATLPVTRPDRSRSQLRNVDLARGDVEVPRLLAVPRQHARALHAPAPDRRVEAIDHEPISFERACGGNRRLVDHGRPRDGPDRVVVRHRAREPVHALCALELRFSRQRPAQVGPAALERQARVAAVEHDAAGGRKTQRRARQPDLERLHLEALLGVLGASLHAQRLIPELRRGQRAVETDARAPRVDHDRAAERRDLVAGDPRRAGEILHADRTDEPRLLGQRECVAVEREARGLDERRIDTEAIEVAIDRRRELILALVRQSPLAVRTGRASRAAASRAA